MDSTLYPRYSARIPTEAELRQEDGEEEPKRIKIYGHRNEEKLLFPDSPDKPLNLG